MKTELSRNEAKAKIEEFFLRDSFSSDEVKKIRRIAMKFKVRLGEHRKKFCRKCDSMLRGSTRIDSGYKKVVCEKCGKINKFKMSQKN